MIAATAAGHTAYAMLPIPPAAPYLQDGRLVALGVSTARRSRLLPDVPPLAAAGVAGFNFPIWHGIWAPAHVADVMLPTSEPRAEAERAAGWSLVLCVISAMPGGSTW